MWWLLSLACAPRTVAPPAALTGEVAPAVLVHELPSELVEEGDVHARVSTVPADLVIFYAGEHKGSLETCGCPKSPRGSLPRLVSMVNASREASPDTPSLLLHVGHWLSDTSGQENQLREDVPTMNHWMLRGMEAVGFQVLNLTWADLPGLESLGTVPAEALSANVRRRGDEPALPTHVVLQAGDLRVGITGISRQDESFVSVSDFEILPPVAAALEALDQLDNTTDLQVLLAFQAEEEAREIARQHPGLDLVIHAGMHREFQPPVLRGQTVFLRSHYQTQRLGELRLLHSDSGVEVAIDRKIDLDPQIPDDPALQTLLLQARGEIEAIQNQLFALDPGTP